MMESARRRAALRLYPGVTIPPDLVVEAAYYSITRNVAFVILSGSGLPLQAPGCRPLEFWTEDAMENERLNQEGAR